MAIKKTLRNQMIRAVASRTPEKVEELISILNQYTGRDFILKDFLVNIGTLDPWEAVSKARLKRAIFRTPKEIKDKMYEGKEPIHGFSRSGHRLKDQILVIAHKYNPTISLNYGTQAIIKIMEAFGTEEQKKPFTPEGQTRIKKEKKKQIHKALKDVKSTIEKLLTPTERMHTESVLRLNETIEKQLRTLDKVLYGNKDFFDMEKNTYLLASQKGGAFSTFFEKNLEKLPMHIRDIYTTIKSPHIEIDEKERDHMMGSLIAYMAMKMPVNTNSAIGGYKKDLEHILGHEDIKETYGEPNLRKAREIMYKPEITLLEATEIFNIYSFDEVRLDVNKNYLSGKKRQDFESIVKELEPLFTEKSNFRDDALTSVPMKRLGEEITSTTLGRNDYEAIRNTLLIQTIAAYENGFYQSQDMQSFKELVDGVVVAKRKLDFMRKVFKEKDVDTKTDNPEELIEIWKPSMLKGTQYDLAENFELEQGMSLDEFIKRGRLADYRFWEKNGARIKVESEVGLYFNPEKNQEELKEVVAKAKELVPYVAVKADYEKASQFIEKSRIIKDKDYMALFLPIKQAYVPDEDKYFRPEEKVRERVRRALEAKKAISALEKKYKEEIDDYFEWRKQTARASFYSGFIGNQIRVESDIRPDIITPAKQIEQFQIVDPEQIEDALKSFDEKYIRADQVSKEWIDNASFLTSYKAKPYLKKKYLQASSSFTWGKIKRLAEGKNLEKIYLERKLVQDIEKLHKELVYKK